MRINEDYLDDIELSDIAQQDNSDLEAQTFMYTFRFMTKEMIKKMPPADKLADKSEEQIEALKRNAYGFYMSKLEQFYNVFLNLAEHIPCITSCQSSFNIHFYNFSEEKKNVFVSPNGITFLYPGDSGLSFYEYITDRNNSNKFMFTFGINCKEITELEQTRRLLITLWRVFNAAVKSVFRSSCFPQIIFLASHHNQYKVEIDETSLSLWTNRTNSKEGRNVFY